MRIATYAGCGPSIRTEIGENDGGAAGAASSGTTSDGGIVGGGRVGGDEDLVRAAVCTLAGARNRLVLRRSDTGVRLRAGRAAPRSGLEGDPAVLVEPHLRPGVGVAPEHGE